MSTTSERARLASVVNPCREASVLLTAAVGSASQLEDAQAQQLALATLEAVGRLEARLQLLDDAYRIADRHRAADLLTAEPPAVAMIEPVVVGVGTALSQVGLDTPADTTYFLDGS